MIPFSMYFDMLTNAFEALTWGTKILSKYNQAYTESYFDAIRECQKQAAEYKNFEVFDNLRCMLPSEELYEEWLKNTDTKLNDLLKSEEFSSLLSNYVESNLEFRKLLKAQGYPIQYFEDIYEFITNNWNSYYTRRKDKVVSEFRISYKKDNTRLMHFIGDDKSPVIEGKNPLLIIYAPINQFHIMYINPVRSVVKSLLSHGIDVYLLDWGYPTSKYNELSLFDYIAYVRDAVQSIQNQTSISKSVNMLGDKMNMDENQMNLEIANTKNFLTYKTSPENSSSDRIDQNSKYSKKISILGYCWGGIIALCYASLNNNSIRNLTLLAVPVDSSKDQTILSTWAKNLDTDKIIDEFGHLNGQVLDIGFIMRNPVRYTVDKYLTMIKKYNDTEFMDIFRSVEGWLYNTPNIPGKLFKDIVNECYKNNSLVKNSIGLNHEVINLHKIDVPIQTIVAENDDLVSSASTMEIENYVSSSTKKMIKFKGGHVGLCISGSAHSQLWPEVADWILAN
jgi:poly[(R)-3-hydroxyalkanoate] polymerase subunit PhaC